jgi:hypothetical protein
MIPKRLADWNYEKIKELVTNNINESEKHDFKSCLPPPIELTKDCCAFANSKGGFIILGIKEHGLKFRIEGIDNDKDLANKFGHKLKALPTNPRFSLGPFIPIPDSNKVLAVIEILKSSHGPLIPADKDQRIFWKRTNTGNEQMSYDEIKEAFQELLKKPDFTKNEIRFRVLFILYMNNIRGQPGRSVLKEEILKKAELEYHDKGIIESELQYLVDSRLVIGIQPSGHIIPYAMMITQNGIDKICQWIAELIKIMNNESKLDYNHVDAVEGTVNKLSEIWKIFKENQDLRRSFLNDNLLL